MRSVACNLRHFRHAYQVTVAALPAHAARHRPKLRQRIAQDKSGHGILRPAGLQMLRQQAIAFGSVEIVCINHNKGFVNNTGGQQNCLCRAPRLAPSHRRGKPRRKHLQFLKNVFHRDALFKSPANGFLERLLHLLAQNKHRLAKARAQSVVNRVIDEGFAARPHRVHLLQAAVAAAHAGSQNEQRRSCHTFHFDFHLPHRGNSPCRVPFRNQEGIRSPILHPFPKSLAVAQCEPQRIPPRYHGCLWPFPSKPASSARKNSSSIPASPALPIAAPRAVPLRKRTRPARTAASQTPKIES